MVLSNLRIVVIAALVGLAIWFFKDWRYQIRENERLSENASSARRSDSLHYNSQLMNEREIREYLEFDNKRLKKDLENEGVKLRRIERIISNRQTYEDKRLNTIQAKGLVLAVQELRPYSVPVVDSTDCLVIRGVIRFDGKEIDLDITDRKFNNVSDVVAFWERRQWKFLGVKTRFLGKKQITATVYNSCGEVLSKTLIIDKK